MWNMMRVARHPSFLPWCERTRGHWKNSARYHLQAIKPVRLYTRRSRSLSAVGALSTSNPFFTGWWLIILAHAISFTFVPMLRRRRRWTRADGRVNYLDGGQVGRVFCISSPAYLQADRFHCLYFGATCFWRFSFIEERICFGRERQGLEWFLSSRRCVPKGVQLVEC